MPKAEYKNRKYRVQPYDPEWPKQFEAEAKIVADIFDGDAIAIEHIGSTSVPGMDGKPTIDVLVLVNDVAAANKYAAAMERAGYEHLNEYVLPNTALFRRMQDNILLSNIHIFQKDHHHVREMLGLRDYLRAHPEEATAYSKIKRELFEQYPDDYGAYRKFKDIYMENLKKRARV